MRRRHFLSGLALSGAVKGASDCGCSMMPQSLNPQSGPVGATAFEHVGSKVKITAVKPFGVSLTPDSDRPYVFVKIETNQPGLVGWGEGTLEGKAAATIACIEDFKEFLIGHDPMLVEHHWQSMYVHSFYRAGPVMGSAISGLDQALWDLSLIHISEPTRLLSISYAVFCLK